MKLWIMTGKTEVNYKENPVYAIDKFVAAFMH